MESTTTKSDQPSTALAPASSVLLAGDSASAAFPPPERVIPPFAYAGLLSHGPYGDFRDSLVKDGFVVIKSALSQERAADIRDRALGWLESFGKGFDRTKPETFGQEFLPQYGRGGMFFSYGIHHEQWVSGAVLIRRVAGQSSRADWLDCDSCGTAGSSRA